MAAYNSYFNDKMTFNNEYNFEKYIRELIDKNISSIDKKIYALRNKKAVDIIICDDNTPPKLFFIEIKYFKNNHGRLGFGGGQGGGFQPEILLKRPIYFEQNLRWILGREDNDKIFFLSNKQISKYYSGGIIGEKFNNIQTIVFKNEKGLLEKEFLEELINWIFEK
jgi:hypothetical protein